jgi:hypothetical protein
MKSTAPEPEIELSVKRSRREDKTRGLIGEDKASDLEQAADPALTEDLALALLARTLSVEAIEELSKNRNLSSARKLRVSMVVHPRTPRRISLKLLRQMHTFDLMRVALLPVMAGDLKRVAAELLVSRLASITLGERISLARRAPETVAAALLVDKEPRVVQAALENPRLTEAAVVKVLARPGATTALVEALCRQGKWSPRHEIRLALLRHPKTPLAHALAFAHAMPPALVRDILHGSQLSEKVKTCLRRELDLKVQE